MYFMLLSDNSTELDQGRQGQCETWIWKVCRQGSHPNVANHPVQVSPVMQCLFLRRKKCAQVICSECVQCPHLNVLLVFHIINCFTVTTFN